MLSMMDTLKKPSDTDHRFLAKEYSWLQLPLQATTIFGPLIGAESTSALQGPLSRPATHAHLLTYAAPG